MDSEDDMDTPVTRRELREEVQHLEDRLDRRLDGLERRLDERWRHYVTSIVENQRSNIGVLDDKYSSLPRRTDALEGAVEELAPRVAVVERKVFAPTKRRPVAKRRRR
jgi:hypothetical protein